VCLLIVHQFSFLLVVVVALLFSQALAAQTGGNKSASTNIEVAEVVPPNASAPAHASSDPQEEGPGSAQPKIQATVGPAKFGLYGTLLLNISASDSPLLGGEVPLWAVPGSGNVTFPDGSTGRPHDLYITARQTVLWFTMEPSSPPTDGWPRGRRRTA
jgi:hypothetical protein